MKHVWVVQEHWDYEGATLHGVYADEDDAMACAQALMAEHAWSAKDRSELDEASKAADRYAPEDHWWENSCERYSAERWEVE